MNPDICDQAHPPVPAFKKKPQWWVDSDFYAKEFASPIYGDRHRRNSTIKSCPAVSDAISMGYLMFMPMDLEVDATDEKYLYWRFPKYFSESESIFGKSTAETDFAAAHDPIQIQKMSVPEGYHRVPFKINTYFGIKTEEGYSTWVTHPMYHDDLPFRILDGIIDTDAIASRFPYPMFIKQGFKGIIKKNTPLIQVIPFKRENFEAEFIDFDRNDAEQKIAQLQSDQIMPYKKMFWRRKSFR